MWNNHFLIICELEKISKRLSSKIITSWMDPFDELISWIRKRKAKAFMFKVDFEKTFDCLNWGYLNSIMTQMNFEQKWINWIMGCLSSARASVIINGAASKEFPLKRGVRQGDSLSPFLFILVAEGLSIAIEEAKEKSIFQGIQLPNNGPSLSHLQYADDAIFLGSWLMPNAQKFSEFYVVLNWPQD